MKSVFRILAVVIVLAAYAFADWSEPVNLGPKINSELDDNGPCVSTNGKYLFFHRMGTWGLQDLYFSEMTDTGWTNAQKLPAPISSPDVDESPFFTRDGTRLYFSSDRPGSLGWVDIWYADYDSVTQQWGEPAVCDTPLNSANYGEGAMTVTGDNQKMYYHHSGQLGPISSATWNGERWTDIRWIGSLIETWDENDPSITPDGNTIYFRRTRIDFGTDIFQSTKYDTCDDCWNEPVVLPEVINGYTAVNPSITADGRRLYFASIRPDGYGGKDIYYSDYTTGVDEAGVPNPSQGGFRVFPNPFNSSVTISYYLGGPSCESLDLRIFDLLGRLVAAVPRSSKIEADGKAFWKINSDNSHLRSSGIFICTLWLDGKLLDSGKITLMK